MNNINYIFFGTPNLSVFVLEELKIKELMPSLVITAPDAPSGRNLVLTPTPVKIWAQENHIEVLEVKSFNDEKIFSYLASKNTDIFVVAAYNFIIPKKILDIPKRGTINVHPSMLPLMRGPSPIRSSILLDQKEAVGVSIMLLDEKIDHGPIIAQKEIKTDTWPVQGRILDEILFREGGKLLGSIMEDWNSEKIQAREQEHEKATFSKKFTKNDGLIDLADDAHQNYLKFCAFDIWPRTFFFQDGKRIIITEADLKDNKFIIKKVIPENGKEQDYRD